MSTIGIADVVDILIVAYLIYQIIALLRRNNSVNIARGLLIFVLSLWASAILRLTMINFLLRKAVELGFIAILILFQPELRRILEKIGSTISSGYNSDSPALETAISQTVLACSDMSKSKTGALIIFERDMKLNEIIATGTGIDATVSSELLKNIFYDKAPLHDGAVILRDGRIESAGCVLPLTKSTNLSKDLGMRHRAGIGLSEQTDAVVVIVSEETGAISFAKEGLLKRHLTPKALDKLLHVEMMKEDDETKKKSLKEFLAQIFKGDADEEKE